MKRPDTTSPEQTVLSDENRQAVALFYNVDADTAIVANERGLVNDTLELGDDLFLTVYRVRTAGELEAVAAVANGMPDSMPISRPLQGRTGYSLDLPSGNALLSPRLPGVHHIGNAHTDKYPIPAHLHRSLAAFFPELQAALSAVPDQMKRTLQLPSRETIGRIPDTLPEAAKPLAEHRPPGPPAAFIHPDLVHDDLERQNILSQYGVITGVTDLDSIRLGDKLYEFSHFLFNMVFCDPEGDFPTAELYLRKLADAGMMEPEDLPAVHKHMYHFAVSDVADFEDLNLHPVRGLGEAVDLDLLAGQYERALYFAARFFEREYPAQLLSE